MAPVDHMRERALSRLRAATSYWLATTRPDGRPHSMPVWGVLVGDEFWFGTAGQKVRNLRHQPYAVVHHESADDVAILEGRVERRPLGEAPEAVVAAFRDKYINPETGEPFDLAGGTCRTTRPGCTRCGSRWGTRGLRARSWRRRRAGRQGRRRSPREQRRARVGPRAAAGKPVRVRRCPATVSLEARPQSATR